MLLNASVLMVIVMCLNPCSTGITFLTGAAVAPENVNVVES